MKKAMKKVIATVMAAALAVGTMGSAASAEIVPVPVDKYNWSVTYYNHPGTGTYTGKKDNCFLTYSKNGNMFALNSKKITVSGSKGHVVICANSSNITSVYWELENVGNQVTIIPKPLSEVRGIPYELYGSTNVVGNTITASGEAHTIK